MFLVVLITIVLGFEIFNLSAERMASWASTYTHDRVREIGLIKDAADGSLLIPKVAGCLVGLKVFLNRLWSELF